MNTARYPLAYAVSTACEVLSRLPEGPLSEALITESEALFILGSADLRVGYVSDGQAIRSYDRARAMDVAARAWTLAIGAGVET